MTPAPATELQSIVDGFTTQIAAFIQRQAMETIDAAFASNGHARTNGHGNGHTNGHASGWMSMPRASNSHPGAKRAPEELAQLEKRFVSFVTANPGLRIEQINKQLGTSTKALALPIRKLIANGSIKPKGQKRSTTYFTATNGNGSNGVAKANGATKANGNGAAKSKSKSKKKSASKPSKRKR